MNFKSKPSEPAKEIRTTLTWLPSLLLRSVRKLISLTLSGDKPLSPVIITYFAGWNCDNSFLSVDNSFLVLKVTASIFSGGFFNKERTEPALVKPISSKAKAIGKTPPSIYSE